MTKRVIACVAFLSGVFASQPVLAQSNSLFDIKEPGAFVLFHQGKLKQAIERLKTVIPQATNPMGKAWLLRDLLETCATGFYWECVGQSLQEISPLLKAEPRLQLMLPDLLIYETKLMRWYGKEEYMARLVEQGGPSSIASPVPHATIFAELQLALHSYYLQKLDARAAEQARSAAMFGLLMAEPKNRFAIAKVLVDLMEVQVEAQDIVGAFALADTVDRFLSTSIPPASVLAARHRMLIGRLLSFANAHALTADTLLRASKLWEPLEIDEEVKAYNIAVANSLATAALALDGKIAEALEVHARHPMQNHKEEIFSRGEFQTYTDFFFGVSDVFLSGAANRKPDTRWRALFDKEPKWKLADYELTDIMSYRNFALGLISLGEGDAEKGRDLVLEAAKERIENFDKVLRINFEGFQLPSLVDKIVIAAGLAAAANRGGDDNIDLMLKGGEVLGRNLRHRLVDIAALLASQPDTRSRRDAQAYIHLADKKRDWELGRIKKLVSNDPDAAKRGEIIEDYSAAIATLASLKEKLQARKGGDAAGLPSLQAIRRTLGEDQAYVGYFPFLAGFGRFCIRRNNASYAIAAVDPAIMKDVELLTAKAAAFPQDAQAATQFPAAASARVYKYMFGGLQACMRPGTHVTMALPPEFASVPLAALLPEEPPQVGGTFDLQKANWLIKQLSFSRAISGRHYLATTAGFTAEPAARNFLGVGDPDLDSDHANKLAATALFRGSLKTPNGILDFTPLPETADELRAAAKLFGAPDTDILLGKRGTEENFRARPLGKYDVIHFATHGLVKEDVKGMTDGALVLTPGDTDDRFDDGLLSASEISRLTLNARLVVLSACNTAKYDVAQVSRGVQDLQAAFTIAGAPTLVASLWPVDSLSTQKLVTGFLQEWRAPQSKGAADALARATRAFLARSDTLHQHPAFWAAFVVVGNGAVSGASKPVRHPSTTASLELLDGFSAGGDILHAARAGPDLILSLIAEWDGKKMNGILTRRTPKGAERWRVGSRQIGAGRAAIGGSVLYATGFTTSELPTPVVRSFDLNGRLRWKKEFADLRGYTLSDIVATATHVFTVAFPLNLPKGTPKHVIVFAADKDGRAWKTATIETLPEQHYFGGGAVAALWNGRLVVALNSESSMQMRFDKKKRLSGLPPTCWEGPPTKLLELDRANFDILRSQPIANFKVGALAERGKALFIGGQKVGDCLLTGQASVLRVEQGGDPSPVWTDDDLFTSSVVGMTVAGKDLVVAVDHKRALGIGMGDTSRAQDYGYKRWSENLVARNEASLLRLSPDGKVLERNDMTAGLNLFLHGVVPGARQVIAYGSLGGVPALARVPDRAKPKRRGPAAVDASKGWSDWTTQIFADW